MYMDMNIKADKFSSDTNTSAFIDAYMNERKRVEEINLQSSSFYGKRGHLNYLNTMFDLFLVSTFNGQ